MPDQPRTDQEQWVADLLRMLGFNVKMNFWPADTAERIEIDVWGRLGPLQVAVECKKYSKDSVGTADIEYFHSKLQMLGQALGIFVANCYSDRDLDACKRLGILPLTTEQVLNEIKQLGTHAKRRKHLGISVKAWQTLAALMKFASDWEGYFDPTWPFHKESYATLAFEHHGLIVTKHAGCSDFQYEHTETGSAFFKWLKNIQVMLEHEEISAMERLQQAAKLVYEACGTKANKGLLKGFDNLVMLGLGLQGLDGRPTLFGELLASILMQAVPGIEADQYDIRSC